MENNPLTNLFVNNISELSNNYKVWFCDVWGVVHNGIAAFPDAVSALKHFRTNGGVVILLTNAPRPWHSIVDQLLNLGIDASYYDAIVSSGDVMHKSVENNHNVGAFHLGPTRDHPLMASLEIKIVDLIEANSVICSGLYDDEIETPEDYRPLFEEMLKRNLTMYCANPDITVRRWDKLIYCAGALAELYADMGGKVILAGKPYESIYNLAVDKATSIYGSNISKNNILAIGDSISTDVLGASEFGIDVVFVNSGIHGTDSINTLHEHIITLAPKARLKAIMHHLAW